MRILYGIAGEGSGHVMRAKEVIDFLIMQGHDIKIFTHNKGYQHLKGKYPLEQILGMRIYYWNNQALSVGTALINILRFPVMLLYNLVKWCKAAFYNPDIVISDFEPWTNYFSYIAQKPLISLENQSVITQTQCPVPKGKFLSWLSSWFVVSLFVPYAAQRICPVFYTPQKKKEKNRCTLITPFMRKEISALKEKAKYGKHMFVYQTSSTNKKMFEQLKKTRETYLIYGCNKKTTDGNLIYRAFNEDNFYRDLAEAKAVICNGGLTLMMEALYLGKPVYSIPVEHQFEQIINAYYLQEMKLGITSDVFDEKLFSNFLNHAAMYKKEIQKLRWDNEKIFKLLEATLQQIQNKKEKKINERLTNNIK